jgi:tripartite-type tricarboxylate transporter receptor subunit TctC
MRSKVTHKRCPRVVLAIVMAAVMLLMAGNVSAANWPDKGKLITILIAYGAGGGADMTVRAMQPFLEQELGAKIVVINKPGGSTQVGTTEYLQKAGTDGYTILHNVLPSFPGVYLDPDRKATYTRKDLQLVANISRNPVGIAVKKGSRYKSLKDLIEAGKANPGKVIISSSGPLSPADLAIFALEKAAGVNFGHIFFDQQGEQRAALLGDHVAAESNPLQELVAGHKSGEVVTLATTSEKQNKFLPDVKTAAALGYNAFASSSSGLTYKAGTPKEIVDTVVAAVKRIDANPEFQKQLERLGVTVDVLVGSEYETYWNQVEDLVTAALADLKTRK